MARVYRYMEIKRRAKVLGMLFVEDGCSEIILGLDGR